MGELVRRRRALYVRDGRIEPAVDSVGSPSGLSRFALLIHGYNNDYEDARHSYQAVKRKLLRSGVQPEIRRNIWELFWPGYLEAVGPRIRRHWRGGPTTEKTVTPISAASYSLQVRKARMIGSQLGVYLLKLGELAPTPPQIILIAHSLGCRLALEAARVLQGHRRWGGPHLTAVFLMAAAVQTDMMGFRERLGDTVYVSDKTYVLHSRRDFVLHRIFPFGQALAFEGLHPEAVGYRGQPSIWSASDETMLDHGEYWESPVTAPHLARLFGVPTRHELPSFKVLEWSAPRANQLPEHQTPPAWKGAEVLGDTE